MTLLNAILAFGALAFTVPLVIHLLHRTKYQVIDWGAMDFLQSTSAFNSRRLQWQQLLLLLLRCLLPILLALAMSRPLIQSWTTSGEGSAVAIAVILDDSMSMQSVDAGTPESVNRTRWEKATEMTLRLVDGIPVGSTVGLVFGGESPTILPSQTPQDVRTIFKNTIRASRSDRSAPVAGNFQIGDSMRLACQWLANSPLTRRQIVILSDYQQIDWPANADEAQRINELLDTQIVRPLISFLTVHESTSDAKKNTAEASNLAIQSVQSIPSILTRDTEVVFVTTIRNYGSKNYENVPVRIVAGGGEIDQQILSFAPGTTTQIKSLWKPSVSGSFVIESAIEVNDTLHGDNIHRKVFYVEEPTKVLIVDGVPKGEPMQSESDFLRLALTPFAIVGQKSGDPFVCTTIPLGDFSEQSVRNRDVIALCNVSSLRPDQVQWLRYRIEQGTAVIIFGGDHMDLSSWNSTPTIDRGGLIPGKLSRKVLAETPADSANRSAAMELEKDSLTFTSIQTNSIEFPPLAQMSKSVLTSLDSVRIQQYLKWDLDGEPVGIVARFINGDPWLFYERLGKGCLIWSTTSCDEGDWNLPSRPIYLPVVQRVFQFAARNQPRQLNLTPGQIWNVEVSFARENQREQLSQPKYVYDPTGREHSVTEANWSETRLLGVYEAVTKVDEVERKEYISVQQSDPEESKLIPCDPEILRTWETACHAQTYSDTSLFLNSMRETWQGREIWSWFWLGAVVCFLAEMLIEQTFLPKRKSTLENAHQHFEGALSSGFVPTEQGRGPR